MQNLSFVFLQNICRTTGRQTLTPGPMDGYEQTLFRNFRAQISHNFCLDDLFANIVILRLILGLLLEHKRVRKRPIGVHKHQEI